MKIKLLNPLIKIIAFGLFIKLSINLSAQNFTVDTAYKARLNTNVEHSFQLNNGKTLVCGRLGNSYNSGYNNLVLLNSNGSIDSSFQCTIGSGTIFFARTLNYGKIFIGGNFTSVNGNARGTAVILNSNGSLNNSFVLDNNLFNYRECYSMEYSNDGNFFLSGNFSFDYDNITSRFRYNTLVKVDSFGNFDTSFKTPYQVNSNLKSKIIKVRDNKYYLLGSFTHYQDGNIRNIIRLKSNGSMDSSFKIRNYSNLNGIAYDLVEYPNKSIVVGGNFNLGSGISSIVKLTDSGYTDNSFSYSGGIQKRYTGYNYQYCYYSYNCGTSFRPRTCYSSYICGQIPYDYWNTGNVYTLSLLPNGNVFVGGDFGRYNGQSFSNGVVITSNGQIDNTMSISFNDVVKTSIALNDNEILVGGLFNFNLFSIQRGNFIKLRKNVRICNTQLPIAMLPGLHTSAYTTTGNDGFKHFCSNNNELLLSLNLGTSGAIIPDNGVTLKINSQLVGFHTNGTGFIANPNGFAIWNRSWDVNPTNQPTGSVSVKYYFNNAMIDSLNNAMISRNLSTVDAIDSLYFFKVTNTSKGIHPIIDSLSLNDIELIKNGNVADINTWVLGQDNNHLFAHFKVNSFSGGGGGASPSGFSPLPIYDLNFDVKLNKNTVALNWQVNNENDIFEYIIEKSIDGINWTEFSRTKSKNIFGNASYVINDLNPNYGLNFYRIHLVNHNFETIESLTKRVELREHNKVSIYPNPAKDFLNIQTNQELLKLEIYNYQGILVLSDSNINNINLQSLQNGAYFIKLYFENNDISFHNFIKNE